MVAYNFKPQFADAVAHGTKLQTIRPIGKKRHVRAGEPIQLYTGMRTKACRKLGETRCLVTKHITLGTHEAWINGVRLSGTSLNLLARQDGFRGWTEMRDWFAETHGMPFQGILICWEAIPKIEGVANA